MSALRFVSLLTIALLSLTGFTNIRLAADNTPTVAALPAFPGAEGYGAETVGGRGGRMIEVTNLEDAGPGSLRACAEASGPRICVFRVAGTITVESDIDIDEPFITIAGQTAPGDGITLKAAAAVESPIHVHTHDVIIRYMRFRPGVMGENSRALSISKRGEPPYNVIVDHISASWSGDELVIVWYDTQNVTLQWNILAESLPSTVETAGLKGPNLGSEGGGNYSFHHNLVAHHLQRSPRISADSGVVDVVNNLVYNPGSLGSTVTALARVNFVGNYVEAGPNTTISSYVKDDGAGGLYVNGNVVEGKEIIKSFLPSNATEHIVDQPFGAPAITTTSAEVAYDQVLSRAGAAQGLNCDGSWFTRRDAVDERIIRSVQENTRGHNGEGYLTNPSEVGGWPDLAPGTPCPDADHDGMPDEWERAQGLNPNQDDSAADQDSDGYTNIEEYMNGLPGTDDQAPSQTPQPAPPSRPDPDATPFFIPLLNK
ncbi:MAG: pectate lyase [Caldilineaceae bacterium]|nr:pectate lyase [Caldilineaceae bacterium]